MPKATVTLSVLVTLDVPAELANSITRDDLVGMARGAVPDSLTIADPKCGRGGACNGTQVEIEGVCQQDEAGEPVFADVTIEHNICEDPEIEFEDEGFIRAEAEQD